MIQMITEANGKKLSDLEWDDDEFYALIFARWIKEAMTDKTLLNLMVTFSDGVTYTFKRKSELMA